MSRSLTRKRPWLAALLAALATGLGHLYLRRWRRALAWLAVLFGVGALFVEPAALQALWDGSGADPRAVAPVLVVGVLSVVDAYLLARAHNAVARLTESADEHHAYCPNCRRELDPEIAFCHWCTTPVDHGGGVPAAERDARDERDES